MSTLTIVRCIVVTDKHGDTHAFKFAQSLSPEGFSIPAPSFHAFTAQVHEWTRTQPFDPGEVLKVATSTLEDPGAARLDRQRITWGEYRMETKES